MNKSPNPSGFVGVAAGRGAAPPPRIDTSDLPDGRAGTKLGTLRDAIERAKVRQKAKGTARPPTRPGG
jgi:hypothetical protein